MAENIFSVSLSVSLMIALLLLIKPLTCKRYGAKWRCCAWLILAIRLVIPFKAAVPTAPLRISVSDKILYSVSVPSENTAAAPVSSSAPSADTEPEQTPVTASAPQKQKDTSTYFLTLLSLARLIWAVGAAAFFIYHTAAYALFRKRIKPCLTPDGSGIYICSAIASPLLIGFIHPIILLPDIDYTAEERDMIIAHEQMHKKRCDLWFKLLLLAASSLHWFNPLVYIMVKNAESDIEYACDDSILKGRNTEYRKKYSEIILKTAVLRRRKDSKHE